MRAPMGTQPRASRFVYLALLLSAMLMSCVLDVRTYTYDDVPMLRIPSNTTLPRSIYPPA